MDEKRALIAVGLSILILLGFAKLFPPAERQQPAPQPIEQAPQGSSLGFDPAPPPPVQEVQPLTEEPVSAAVVAAAAEERITIDTRHFIAELTNRGGRLLSFRLKDYLAADQPLEMFPAFAEEEQSYLSVDLDDRDLARRVNEGLFTVERDAVDRPEGGGQRVSFVWSDGAGLEVKKSVTFWDDDWVWEADLEVIDRGRRIPARFVIGPGLEAQEERGSRTYYYSSQLIWYDSNGVNRSAEHCGFFIMTTACRDWKTAIKQSETPEQGGLSGNIRWAGLEDQFFAALAISRGTETELRWATRELTLPASADDDAPEPQPTPFISVSVPPEGTRFYIGPKLYTELEHYGVHLEEVVWFSSKAWLAAIVRTMYFGLQWIHDHVLANWGVAIILATVVLRLLLFPLNQFAMLRMRKTQQEMQRIQPKLKGIRGKYAKKKDAQSRQKMNEETMALYKKEGINPMGGVTGCLPMFLQFPILIGFYNMLTVAVELRGAQWLWIHDLSQSDPVFVIPIAMGVTMFLQQKMSMSKVTDPMAQQQQKFMMFMPFMFTFFCLQMPAGMVLYWFVNNLLGIGQQRLVNRQAARSAA